MPRNNTSGYKGVSWHKQMKRWWANITVNGRHFSLGLFSDKKEAAIAYEMAASKYQGEFAYLELLGENDGK